ncbi:MAG: Pyrophosphate--fructose 6-phosphate 1-phosphotransferase [Candidatus Anoxychlamydiales bacterium]|nr:Pyrophosphate--fructose 6-phosphate 1-phosphotransferase [Candidatus Anoxychlamydiales bacterium]NGX35917.1 Pyrophosphate--fructose 6-phosphate 1-phosphotransferase [Candidatus Anoxychlamydiales bacterium]
MQNNISELQKERLKYVPKLPKTLEDISKLEIDEKEKTTSINDAKELEKIFSNTFGKSIVHFKQKSENKDSASLIVGVVFSGGQAPGGHNVISGLFDALKRLNPKSQLYGYLNGPSGVVDCKYIELTKERVDSYRNLGGFDLIGSGRTKIETDEQLEKSLICAKDLKLDGIVIIGGDDSNTNAAILAEYFKKKNISTSVVGVPKTIDGDLKSKEVEISFGFDTACKVYSELIGNIAKDAISAKKYYHFIRLMGRSASHIALECALKTHPNIVLIGEEILKKKKTLKVITNKIADVIEKRAKNNKNYGIVLVPEGLIEFIPEFKSLISELNKLLATGERAEKELANQKDKIEYIKTILSKESKLCFEMLPKQIQEQLLLDRDPHGNVKVSQIETEKLLIETIKKELKNRAFEGKFNALSHFFGYEGRSGMPTNFDANYCYSLGHVAALLINEKLSGYMSSLGNLDKDVSDWVAKGVPITSLMNLELRHGNQKPVIKKALVELDSKAFKYLVENREKWALNDFYTYPGSIQYFGNSKVTDATPITLSLK